MRRRARTTQPPRLLDVAGGRRKGENASLSCMTVNALITIEQHFKTIGNISEMF
jgi:hypothetical protein